VAEQIAMAGVGPLQPALYGLGVSLRHTMVEPESRKAILYAAELLLRGRALATSCWDLVSVEDALSKGPDGAFAMASGPLATLLQRAMRRGLVDDVQVAWSDMEHVYRQALDLWSEPQESDAEAV
jgi:hypothetical protein